MDIHERLAIHQERCNGLFWDGYVEKLAAMTPNMSQFQTMAAAQLPTNPQNGAPTPPAMTFPTQPGAPSQFANTEAGKAMKVKSPGTMGTMGKQSGLSLKTKMQLVPWLTLLGGGVGGALGGSMGADALGINPMGGQVLGGLLGSGLGVGADYYAGLGPLGYMHRVREKSQATRIRNRLNRQAMQEPEFDEFAKQSSFIEKYAVNIREIDELLNQLRAGRLHKTYRAAFLPPEEEKIMEQHLADLESQPDLPSGWGDPDRNIFREGYRLHHERGKQKRIEEDKYIQSRLPYYRNLISMDKQSAVKLTGDAMRKAQLKKLMGGNPGPEALAQADLKAQMAATEAEALDDAHNTFDMYKTQLASSDID